MQMNLWRQVPRITCYVIIQSQGKNRNDCSLGSIKADCTIEVSGYKVHYRLGSKVTKKQNTWPYMALELSYNEYKFCASSKEG